MRDLSKLTIKGTRVSLRTVDADGRSVGPILLGTVGELHPSKDDSIVYFDVLFDDGTRGIFSEARGDEVDGSEKTTLIGAHASDMLDEANLLVDDEVNEYAGYLMVVLD